MKRTVIDLLAFFGALVILYVGLGFIFNAINPGYRERARQEFGSPEAIQAIAALYQRIELSPHDQDLKLTKESYDVPKFPTIRRIPKSWLPEQFSTWAMSDDSSFGKQVFALYDNRDQFVRIVFHGSRYGGFVSRDPTRCPSNFRSLYLLVEEPVCIRAIVNDYP